MFMRIFVEQMLSQQTDLMSTLFQQFYQAFNEKKITSLGSNCFRLPDTKPPLNVKENCEAMLVESSVGGQMLTQISSEAVSKENGNTSIENESGLEQSQQSTTSEETKVCGTKTEKQCRIGGFIFEDSDSESTDVTTNVRSTTNEENTRLYDMQIEPNTKKRSEQGTSIAIIRIKSANNILIHIVFDVMCIYSKP